MEIVSTRMEYPYTAFPTGKKMQDGLDCGYSSFAGIGITGAHLVIMEFCAAFISKNPAVMSEEISPVHFEFKLD